MTKPNWRFLLLAAALATVIVTGHRVSATLSSTTTQTLTSLGNSSTTNYTIGFTFQANSNIQVYLQDESVAPFTRTLLVYGSGAGKYTITGGDPGTTVVMGTAPTATQRLIIKRVTPNTQTVAYLEGSAFPAKDHEKAMDKLTMELQEMSSSVTNKVGLSTASTATVPTMPDPFALRFLGYNTGGTDLTYYPASTSSLTSGDVLRYDGTTWSLFNIPTATGTVAADLATHLADHNNPHVVTPAQVGNTTAQWNANKIQGTAVDASGIGNGKILQFDSGSGNIIYAPAPLSPTLTDTHVFVGNGSSQAIDVAISGDATLADTGALTIANSAITDAKVSATAAIARSKLGTGTINQVVINDGTGALSSEAQLAPSRGGTGAANSGSLSYGSSNITLTTSGATALTLPTSGTVATLTGTETLANKTLTSPAINTPTVASQTISDFSDFSDVSTPANPSSGKHRVYVKSDGHAYVLDPAGNETPLGSGSGQGGINYLVTASSSNNSDAETSVGTWVAYSNTAQATPVTGAGGSPTVTMTRTTSSPLRGNGSLLFTKTAVNSQGQGASVDFTIDSADEAKVLNVSFDYAVASGTYTDGDLTVYIYDKTNGVVIQPAGYQILSAATGLPVKQVSTTFQTASNSTSYRLIFHVASTSASAYTVKFDNIVVGPQIITQGTPVTDWTAYTPTFTGFGTVTNINMESRRFADTLQIRGTFQIGTPTATTAQMTLGFGGADGNVTTRSGLPANNNVGDYSSDTVSATYFGAGNVIASSGNNFVYFGKQSSSTQGNAAATGSTLFGNLSTVSIYAAIPIQGWSSQVEMSDSSSTRVLALDVTGATTSLANATVTQISFPTVLSDNAAGFSGGTTYTVSTPGYWLVSEVLSFGGAASGQGQARIYKNGSVYNTISAGQITTAGLTLNNIQLIPCNAGDTLTFYGYQSSGGALALSDGHVSIFRLSGPSQIAASESVYASYTSNNSAAIGTSFGLLAFNSLIKDTHNSYSAGVYTCGTSGQYEVSVVATTAGVSLALGSQIEFALYKNGSFYSDLAWVAGTNGGSIAYRLSGSSQVPCNASDTLSVYAVSSTATTLYGVAGYSHLDIKRIGN